MWYLNTCTSSKFPKISLSFSPSAVCYVNAEYICSNISAQAILNPFGVIISSRGENRSTSLKLQQVQHSRPSNMTMEAFKLLPVLVQRCRTTKLKAKNLIVQIWFSYFRVTEWPNRGFNSVYLSIRFREKCSSVEWKENLEFARGKEKKKSNINLSNLALLLRKRTRIKVYSTFRPLSNNSRLSSLGQTRRKDDGNSFLFSQAATLSGLYAERLTIITMTLNNWVHCQQS